MVCYAVPLAATIIVSLKRLASRKKTPEGFWLNLLLLGGALFGVIDHFWNGELFLIGPNIFTDLALGVTITAGIFVAWGTIVFREKITYSFRFLSRRTGIYNHAR
jgi:hypothetical protein